MEEYCYEEKCRYRHWTSGSVPTHRRGADCPEPKSDLSEAAKMSGEPPALDQLEMYADESIGATYGTLSASIVAQLVSVARDEHAAELAAAERRGAVRALREAAEDINGQPWLFNGPRTETAAQSWLLDRSDRMEDENG